MQWKLRAIFSIVDIIFQLSKYEKWITTSIFGSKPGDNILFWTIFENFLNKFRTLDGCNFFCNVMVFQLQLFG